MIETGRKAIIKREQSRQWKDRKIRDYDVEV